MIEFKINRINYPRHSIAWRNWQLSLPSGSRDSHGWINTWLAVHNGRDKPGVMAVEFESEEDVTAFILKFG